MITIEEQLAEVQRLIQKMRGLWPEHKIEIWKAVRDTLLAQSILSKKIGEEI
jgi:hypothetical protein